jgi:hypothetical protein
VLDASHFTRNFKNAYGISSKVTGCEHLWRQEKVAKIVQYGPPLIPVNPRIRLVSRQALRSHTPETPTVSFCEGAH